MNSAMEVLALKYRPKRFEDLIGQETISVTLSLALDSNRLSHAYLFSGLRGSGKTSTARIMAKALVCEHAPTSKPCEICDGCKAANENRHLDIIEMDAASNRGIDDIKDLIEHTKYKPTSAKFKVFIIDEVHMLTTQAFNALLKTLEEPPNFVKFILATTDPLKLPATILSRTQHFRFKRISDANIIHHLSHILNIENISFETEALQMLTRSGNGSLRDTLTLLDQAIIYSKGTITATTVTDMLGMIDPAFLDNMFDLILQKGDIRELVDSLQSYETGQVLDEIAIYLKQKMLENNMKFDLYLFDRFYRIIADAKQLLNLNSDNGFVLILTLSKMVEAVSLKTIDEVIEQIQNKEEVQSTSIIQPIIKQQEPIVAKTIDEKKPIEQEPLIQQNIQQVEPVVENIALEQKQVETPTPLIEQPKENINILFKNLITNIYDKNYDLGECFEKSFHFHSHINNILKIDSTASGECKKSLYKNFSYIKQLIEEVYGENIEIEFNKIQKEPTKEMARVIKATVFNNTPPQETFAQAGSMIEDLELNQSSSCVSSMCDTTNPSLAQVDLKMEDILNSKMVKTAIELFQPPIPPKVKSKN